MKIARSVRVRGRVQGVFFRAWLRSQALRAGVAGWVANCGDGSVHAKLEGEAGAIDELLRLMRMGPPGARVDSLDVEESKITHCTAFEVRRLD